MTFLNNEEKTFCKALVKKTIVTFGVAVVGLFVGFQFAQIYEWIPLLYSAAFTAAAYMFAELAKYYGVQPSKKVTNKTYDFLI